ncbi:UDP-N-acetyl-D-mannosamine dehydrogenase [Candidatus Thiosymbion oneisti]|uniref:UDP-N-acetyl-D-mannosamine dehydrogenase n=1 Tax=Candidatus Thiosymbion oneisti TaxID=589554 RepID=UPI000AB5EE40|nr:UDP-N-acetyl-D-mannosamine dehydrogenase [Candidatus Thiosymbion oneisti]
MRDPQGRKICVMGLGYIGLPTAGFLASKGFEVHGVDVNPAVVETVNTGRIHIHEPELERLVESAVRSGRFKAATQPVAADIFILAVPTPFKDDHEPDLGYVEAATRAVVPQLVPGNLVILESTSPVGTTERVAHWLAEERPELAIAGHTHHQAESHETIRVAYCPERVLPGRIIQELVANDRIVGGIDATSTAAAADFYREFVAGKVLTTDSRTAELTKLAENTFRDVNVALANELSRICGQLSIDVRELIRLANHHPRVEILRPGPGVGGHCIAVDPWFIIHSVPEQSRLIRAAREVNIAQPEFVVTKVRAEIAHIRHPTIACFGLAYKADIDDLRESPAIEIALRLAQERNGRILVVEPHIEALPIPLADAGVRLYGAKEALAEANIVLGLVPHTAFRKISRQALQEKIVIDTCGLWK